MDDVVNYVKTSIDNFILSNLNELSIEEELNKPQRHDIHQYAEEKGLYSLSVNVDGSLIKKMIIRKDKKYDNFKSIDLKSIDLKSIDSIQLFLKYGNDKDVSPKSIDLSSDSIEMFIKYSRVPIPLPLSDSLDYYLELLDPYYNAKEKFSQYINSIKKYKNSSLYSHYIKEVMDKIIDKFNENAYFKQFKSMKPNKYNYSTLLADVTNKKIYVPQNHNKMLLSIDMKTAQFNVIKHYNKDAVLGFDKWIDLVSSFTDDKFIINSKYFREIIFGKLGVTQKAIDACTYHLEDIYEYIKDQYDYTDSDLLCVSSDEIVLKYNGKTPIDIDDLFPNKFNVCVYNLKKIDNKPYYVREIVYPTKRIDFKCVDKNFICQAIKKIEGRKIEDNDLRFIINGYIAKYEKPQII